MPDQGEAEVLIKTTVGGGLLDGAVVANSAMTSADTYDNNNDNNYSTAFVGVYLVKEARLSIDKSVSDLTPVAGDELIYSIEVRNHGTATAFGVVVDDLLPADVTYVVDTANGTGSGNDRHFELGNLAPGESVSFDILTTVNRDAECGATLTNKAVANANEVSEAVTGTANVVVLCVSDLSVAKYVKPDETVLVDTPYTYTIFVENLGPSPVDAATLDDIIFASGDFEVISVQSDRDATCVHDTLPAIGKPIQANLHFVGEAGGGRDVDRQCPGPGH